MAWSRSHPRKCVPACKSSPHCGPSLPPAGELQVLLNKDAQNLPPESKNRSLIDWFIRNPVAANLLMVVLLVGGALSAVNLQRQVFPTISPGTVVVTVPFPGATPAEVEEGVTRRVEEAVLGIDGVKRVTSTASENVGRVVVEA